MARGELRIYLGAAPGVGKTYAMLDEAHRRRDRGTDVVVAFVDAHGRPGTAAHLHGLEVLTRRRVVEDGRSRDELDLDAVLARAPAVALVDDLAHQNDTAARHPHRWQDVEELLAAGIDVVSTIDISQLESVNDLATRITGTPHPDTVPDRVVRAAAQVQLVDMTPEALRRRLAHGNVYPPERIDAALSNYFRPGNLAALRELALLWVADRVEESLQGYLETHGIEGSWETRERIVVAVSGAPGGEDLVRRAARIAGRLHADLIGVHVSPPGRTGPSGVELARHRQLLHDLGGRFHEVIGTDPGRSLADFAVTERATQLVLGSTGERHWLPWHRTVADRVMRRAPRLEVHVMTTVGGAPGRVQRDAPTLARVPRPRPIARWRQVFGFAIGAIGLPLVTVGLVAVRAHLDLSTTILAYLTVVLGATAAGGAAPGLAAAVAAFLLENYYFVEPTHTFSVAQPRHVVSLLGFLGLASAFSIAVHALARRSSDVRRARAEAAALARTAVTLAGEVDSLPLLVDNLRTTFEREAVSVLSRFRGGPWSIVASSGEDPPSGPDDGAVFLVEEDTVLVLRPARLAAEDRLVIDAFAAQMAAVLRQRRLHAEAVRLSLASEADTLRTGLLRSVSHDLRTPLAGIKASVTSLLADDVAWDDEQERDFLRAIDADCDRLTRLVTDLLDASRLQAGVVAVRAVAVGLDDVVASAIASLTALRHELEVDLPDDAPVVVTDPSLLERAVANLVANADRYSPRDKAVRITGDVVGTDVRLLVIDRGPGIPASRRGQVLAPFQRLDDAHTEGGVGLGLSIVEGFVQLLGGSLVLEDTPGGGLTAIISLPGGDASTCRPTP